MLSTTAKPIPKGLILFTVMIGTFLGRLDQTIVNLALPDIVKDFGITVSASGWIATAYILANAVFVPIWGKLGDALGRKKVYLIGFGLFVIASIFAGLAWNLESMIFFRVIQAIAGSADYPTAMAILAVTYTDEKERAQALGIWSASFAASAVLGPLVGGPLIDLFGWRSVFLINLPVGVLGFFMAMAFIEESKSEQRIFKFDWWGAIALGIALTAVVLVLDKGQEWGWFDWKSLMSYVVGLAGFLSFIQIERHHPEPIVDLQFFKNSVFVQTLFNNFLVFLGMMGSMFLIPLFSSIFLGLDATETGYLFIPMAAALMLAAPLGGKLTGVFQPRYVIMASTFVAGIGVYLFSFMDARSTSLSIIIPMVIMAFGMGFGMAQRTNIVASAVKPEEIGTASSILALVRNIAGAFGIAIFGTLLNSSVENNLLKINQMSSFQGTDVLQYQQYISLMTLKAQINGYNTVFETAAVLVIIGAFLAYFIGNVKIDPKIQVHVE